MTFNPLAILRRPIVTERSTLMREQNRFTFEVSLTATKGQIREAIESAFKVDVLAVNTMRMLGKERRRMGPKSGFQPEWKKAIVTLKKGQEIKYAEPTA
jgi:large subunit ribosomal protein L23